MAIPAERWWQGGAWALTPAERRSGSGSALAAAAMLVAIEVMHLAASICSTVAYARGTMINASIGAPPSASITLMQFTRDLRPFDGLVLVVASLLLAATDPGGRHRLVRSAARATAGVLAITSLLVVVAAFADVGRSPSGFTPLDVTYGSTTILICDRLALAVTAVATLGGLHGEALARRITAGRVRRLEG